MKNLILLLIVVLWGSLSYSQSFVTFTQKEFDSSQFNKNDYIKNALNNVRIVGLGENSHNMGTIYTAKVKFVKYLHENLGYNTIAFESGIYDLYKANQILQTDTVKNYHIFNALFGIWACEEVDELVQYIMKTQKTNNPLKIVGFDCQFTGLYSIQNFISDFHAFVDSLSKITDREIKLEPNIDAALQSEISKSNTFSKLSSSDTSVLFHTIQLLSGIIEQNGLEKEEYFNFWNQILINVEMDYRRHYCQKCNIRDSMMAKNVEWIEGNKAVNVGKLMLWAASFHLAFNTSEIRNKSYHSKTMGSFLKEQYKERYYTIAFTPGYGRGGWKEKGILSYKIKPPTTHSLENIFYRNHTTQFGFIDLNNPINKDFLKEHKITKSKFFWRKEILMDCAEVMNAEFFVRKENSPHYPYNYKAND